MAKIIKDKQAISELLERGVEKIFPNAGLLEKKLMSGERLKIYCGYDPTASALHIGNAITLNKLAQFQKLGHQIIFLIGDFTCMIGDPTDKKATRKQMTRSEVLHNAKDYQRQASAYLQFSGSNPAKIMYNSKWNDKLKFKDLISLASNFTVQQMIQRDMFQERLKEERPIYLHEFMYPLTQAHDSVAMDVDVEIGGNDQMFNMLCGRDLLKALKNKEKCVLTLKLLTDNEGKKMGKSEGNIVFLNESPEEMYGKIMSWPDGTLTNGFELCTFLPLDECQRLQTEAKNNPRNIKMRLAFEITSLNHGSQKALSAQEYFIKTVQNKEIPSDMTTYKMKDSDRSFFDILLNSQLVKSKGEARRLMEQHGLKIKIDDNEIASLKDGDLTPNFSTEIIIQRGKHQFLRIIK